MNFELKSVYSLNLAVYAKVFYNINYVIKSDADEPDKKYIQFDCDITDIKNEYLKDKKLQAFLHGFKQLKLEMRNAKQ